MISLDTLTLLNIKIDELNSLNYIFIGGALISKLQENWKVIRGSILYDNINNINRILITNGEKDIIIANKDNQIIELYEASEIDFKTYIIFIIIQDKYNYKFIPSFGDWREYIEDLDNEEIIEDTFVSPLLLQQFRLMKASLNNDEKAKEIIQKINLKPIIIKYGIMMKMSKKGLIEVSKKDFINKIFVL